MTVAQELYLRLYCAALTGLLAGSSLERRLWGATHEARSLADAAYARLTSGRALPTFLDPVASVQSTAASSRDRW